VQVPDSFNVIVLPLTVQTEAVEEPNVIASPEAAEATRVGDIPLNIAFVG
jgi:hypothetical protein